MKYNPYSKVVNLKKEYALCAIFEPHPFRCSAISDAVKQSVNTGIKDNEWCWVYYDCTGNPVAIGNDKPSGIDVDTFTPENLGFDCNDDICFKNGIDLSEYLNARTNK